MANVKPPGKTRLLAESLIHAAMRILRDNGKEMPIRDVMARVEKKSSSPIGRGNVSRSPGTFGGSPSCISTALIASRSATL